MSFLDNFKDVIKLVREIDNKELYEKLLDLQAEAQDLREKIIEYKDKIREKDKKIEELEKKLNVKEEITYKERAYYKVNDEEEIKGDPYCPRCWDSDKELIHLQPASRQAQKMGKQFYCPNCEQRI